MVAACLGTGPVVISSSSLMACIPFRSHAAFAPRGSTGATRRRVVGSRAIQGTGHSRDFVRHSDAVPHSTLTFRLWPNGVRSGEWFEELAFQGRTSRVAQAQQLGIGKTRYLQVLNTVASCLQSNGRVTYGLQSESRVASFLGKSRLVTSQLPSSSGKASISQNRRVEASHLQCFDREASFPQRIS